MTIEFDPAQQKRAITYVVIGAAIFFMALSGEIQADHTWGDLIGKPQILIFALGKVAGWIVSVVGARNLFPPERTSATSLAEQAHE
jgi:hypothetical protein